jgi:prenyltransferase beta subunit
MHARDRLVSGTCIGLSFAWFFAFAAPTDAWAQRQAKNDSGFADTRQGDIPEGAAEMITPETDRVITSGLSWLAKQQNADGSFGNGPYRSNIAVTALSGLAFMASGSSPGRGQYGPPIDKALQFVMDNTAPSGFIAIPQAATHGPMYSHGFGTLFLAEAYGMTHRPELREKLEKAVRLIVDTQNIEGGWRYQPIRRDADISVTVCQINALRAARNAGIFVPKETVDACIRYVKQSQNPDGGFRYMLMGGASAFPRSAAGLVALYSAAVYDSKEIEPGIAYVKQFVPEIKFGQRFSHYFYGHYYAAQAMWIRGGAEWSLWYPAIRDELVRRQSPQGFWIDSICNEYGTAMALIVLQMPNNCLPIFQR